MKVLDIVSTANENLRRSKLRTFLTMLAIAIGTFTLSLSLGLGQGVRAYITSQLGQYQGVNLYRVTRLGAESFTGGGFGNGDPKKYDVNKVQAPSDLIQVFLLPNDVESIKAVSGVKHLRVPHTFNFLYAVAADGQKYEAPASQYFPEMPTRLVAGKQLDDSQLDTAMLSRKYLSLLGVQTSEQAIGRTITVVYKTADGALSNLTLKISGVFEPTLFDQPFVISEQLASQLAVAQNPTNSAMWPAVFVERDTQVSEADFKSNLKKIKFNAQSIADMNKTINNLINGVQIALAGFSCVAILASVVGVVNTLFMAVLERTREIGLFRALGAKRKTIFALFSVEAMLIGFWGSIFGLALAFVAQISLNHVASRTFLKGVEGFHLLALTPFLVTVIIAGIAAVTLLAGLLPALKASRLDPIEALRYE